MERQFYTPEKNVFDVVMDLDIQADYPPKIDGRPDEALAAFSRAAVQFLLTSPEVSDTIEQAIKEKQQIRPFGAVHAANFIFRFAQLKLMGREDYPFTSDDEWFDQLGEVFSHEGLEDFRNKIIIFNVSSDVETRSAGAKLVAHTLLPRLAEDTEDKIKILDIGSARDHGLVMIANNMEYPHVAVEAPDNQSDYETYSADELEEKINAFLAAPINLDSSYGVDVWQLEDVVWRDFSKACRFYPSELQDPVKIERYNSLEEKRRQTPQLHHSVADFARLSDDESSWNKELYKGLSKNDKYDLIMFSTSMHQNNEEARRNMMQNAIDRIKQSGKIVVQDFFDILPADERANPIDQIAFNDTWYNPWTYTTAVYDPTFPEKGFESFVEWNNSRCEKIKPGKLILKALGI